jgi:hypothetical protein
VSLARPWNARRPGTRRIALPALGFFLFAAWLSCVLACSCSPSAGCNGARCASGTACIDDGSGKGPACHAICAHQSDCASGSYCNDGQPQSWCVPATTAYPRAPGQWGAPCVPPKESNNSACDSADGFACYGITPTDANAFCTTLGCKHDSDCPGGWWCATVDQGPNVATDTRTFGPTRQACLPRRYCAPCTLDHDCPPNAAGQPQYCISDSQGAGYCTTRCAGPTNCKPDATCTAHWKLCLPNARGASCTRDEDCPPNTQNVAQHCDFGASADGGSAGTTGLCAPECGSDADCDSAQMQRCAGSSSSYCTPRAGVCKGDGGYCSPCRSDADCNNGYCIEAPYSGELFCTQAAHGTCPATGAPLPGTCPSKPAGASGKAYACLPAADPLFGPANQCIELVTMGTDPTAGGPVYNPGCWTPDR